VVSWFGTRRRRRRHTTLAGEHARQRCTTPGRLQLGPGELLAGRRRRQKPVATHSGLHAAVFVLAAARGGNGGLQPGRAWTVRSRRRGSEEVGRRVSCTVLQTSWRRPLRPARGSLWRGRLCRSRSTTATSAAGGRSRQPAWPPMDGGVPEVLHRRVTAP
jgi:hypothetical protein